MPITAFSRHYDNELDVTQIIGRLAADEGVFQLDAPAPGEIPENWRRFIRESWHFQCRLLPWAQWRRPGMS